MFPKVNSVKILSEKPESNWKEEHCFLSLVEAITGKDQSKNVTISCCNIVKDDLEEWVLLLIARIESDNEPSKKEILLEHTKLVSNFTIEAIVEIKKRVVMHT